MGEKLIVSGVALALSCLAWFFGGLQNSSLVPLVWATVILFLGLFIYTFRSGSSRHIPYVRDVFFWAGLLFLGYLGLQWWNAGRILYYDVGIRDWRYSLPRHPGWPSAFSKQESSEMVKWFLPAWMLGLVVRSPLIGKQSLLGMLKAVVFGAGALAFIGILQFITQAKGRYWIRPTEVFFASFGYTNHAAAYFVLTAALAAGLLFREVFRTKTTVVARWQIPALSITLLLCLAGANLSLSRAGIILAWLLVGFVALYGLVRGWRSLHPAARINLAAATIAIVFVLYFMVAGFGKEEIAQEFAVQPTSQNPRVMAMWNINLSFCDRPLLAKTALAMWKDHPLFGIGGWGFRHLLSLYLPASEWPRHVASGNANVHSDGIQFLAEFGIAGFGLMSLAGLALVVPLVQTREWRHPLWIMGTGGLALIAAWSFIDLPFRCPAILCTWTVILSALPKVSGRTPASPVTRAR